jgi:hypothetical protein
MSGKMVGEADYQQLLHEKYSASKLNILCRIMSELKVETEYPDVISLGKQLLMQRNILDSIGLTFCDFTIVNNKAVCNNADALTKYEAIITYVIEVLNKCLAIPDKKLYYLGMFSEVYTEEEVFCVKYKLRPSHEPNDKVLAVIANFEEALHQLRMMMTVVELREKSNGRP